MKKIIITFAFVLMLSLSVLLTACGGGSTTEQATTTVPQGTTSEKATNAVTEPATEKVTGGMTTEIITEVITETQTTILDEAESKLEEMSEDATHGTEAESGTHSSRGGKRTVIPRAK